MRGLRADPTGAKSPKQSVRPVGGPTTARAYEVLVVESRKTPPAQLGNASLSLGHRRTCIERLQSYCRVPMPAHMSRSARIPQKPVLGAQWLGARRCCCCFLRLPSGALPVSYLYYPTVVVSRPHPYRQSGTATREAGRHTQPRCRPRMSSRARSALPVCPALRPRLDPYCLPADSIYALWRERDTHILHLTTIFDPSLAC